MRHALAFALVAAFLLATACQGTGASSAAAAAAAGDTYTLALLRSGEHPPQQSKEERAAMFRGHMENMNRLAHDGNLVLAGPYGKQRSAADLRGVFVLATADAAQARAWAETDPGFRAGEFRFELHELRTAAALRALLAAELAREAEITKSGRTPNPAEGMRGYVLLTADHGDLATELLATHPKVLLFGRLDGASAGAFAILDAADLAAAQALVAPLTARLGAHRLDEWFGTSLVAELPRLGRG